MNRKKSLFKLSNLMVCLMLLFSIFAPSVQVWAQEGQGVSTNAASISAESVVSEVDQAAVTEESSSEGESTSAQPAAEIATRDVNGVPKALTGVVVPGNSVLYDVGRSEPIRQEADGKYPVYRNVSYRYGLAFDLSAYNGNVNNGDYFTVNISAPATLTAGQTVPLVDNTTQVQIGTAKVTSNGPNAGGKVVVTMANLDEYLRRKGTTVVEDIKGTIWLDWKTSEPADTATLTSDNLSNGSSEVWNLRLKTPTQSVYSADYNFAKRHGAVQKKPYNSAILGKSGNYIHQWTADMNFLKGDYSTVVMHDDIYTEGGPMQFIPESFVVRTGEPNNQLNIDKPRTLDPSEYTITFNAAYTSFDLTIPNANNKAYKISYSTTSPADGSRVGNVVSMTGDGVALEQKPKTGRMSMLATNSSKVTEGGSIQVDTAYRVLIYKTDAATGERLAGAVFELRKTDGTTITLDPTDAEGRTVSPAFKQADVNTEVQVVEVTPPPGYEAAAPTTVRINKDGVFKTIPNTRRAAATPVTVTLEGKKVVEGKSMQAAHYEFELVDHTDNTVAIAANGGDGRFVFPEMVFDESKVGTHTYTIKEVLPTTKEIGMTYDETTYTAVVQVTKDDATNTLVATVTYNGETATPIFTNRYAPLPVNVVFEAEKTLRNKTLTVDEFEFELYDAQGTKVATTTNTADGRIVFPNYAISTPGTHKFTIKEKQGDDPQVTYSQNIVTATVEVVDRDGQLTTTALTYEGQTGNTRFDNIYQPTAGQAVIKATKELQNKPLEDKQFEFELVDAQGGVVETVQNKQTGEVVFSPLVTTTEGTQVYTIREKQGNVPGVTYSQEVITATVTTTNENGQYVSTVAYDKSSRFVNVYQAAPSSLVIQARKVLRGQSLVADQFEFELVNAQGEVLQTAKNDAAGVVSFAAIPYDAAGEYGYVIREKHTQLPGVTYDNQEVPVSVSVRDQGAQLVATAVYEQAAIFTNTYQPAAGSVVIEATKRVNGFELKANQFDFVLKDDQGKVLQTKQNDINGKVIFDAIPYTTAGTYRYTIEEVAGQVAGYTYAANVSQVTVEVTDNNAVLNAVATYETTNVFENVYTPAPGEVVLQAQKVLQGKSLEAAQFTFELLDAQGTVIQTVNNGADGSVVFSPIQYTAPGTSQYTIREKNTGLAGVTYDTHTAKVTVEVTDVNAQLQATATYDKDAVFTNVYVPAAGSAVITATTTIDGATLIDNQFVFELLDSQGTVIQTKQHDVTGAIVFDALSYHEVGTYHYKLRERNTGLANVIYEDKEFEVVVEVTEKDAALVATVKYLQTPNFHHTYREASKPVQSESSESSGSSEKLSNSEKPENSEKQARPTQSQQSANKGEKQLPKTGEETIGLLWVFAVVLMFIAINILVKKHRSI